MARRIKTVLSPSGDTEKGKRLIRLVKKQWKTRPVCTAQVCFGKSNISDLQEGWVAVFCAEKSKKNSPISLIHAKLIKMC